MLLYIYTKFGNKMYHISVLMCAKFEGNLITCVLRGSFFANAQKEEEITEL